MIHMDKPHNKVLHYFILVIKNHCSHNDFLKESTDKRNEWDFYIYNQYLT